MRNYSLLLVKDQIDVIKKALNLYISVGIGQFEEAMYAFNWHTFDNRSLKLWKTRYADAKDMLRDLELLVMDGEIKPPTPKIEIALKILENITSECTLLVNEKEAKVLEAVLDFYSRIGLGQFEEIASGNYVFGWNFSPTHHNHYHSVKELLDGVKFNLLGLPSCASLGISCDETPESAKIAYDIQQVIRHRLAWDKNPKGGLTVNFDRPMKCSNLNLPTITENK